MLHKMNKYILILVGCFLALAIFGGIIAGNYNYNLKQSEKHKDIPTLSLDCGQDEGDSCSTFEGTFNYVQTTLNLAEQFTQGGVRFVLAEELK